jgi:hypothetical protein
MCSKIWESLSSAVGGYGGANISRIEYKFIAIRVGHTILIDFLDAPVNYHFVDGILDKTLLRVDRAIKHNHVRFWW